ncbi:MAG: class I SAM-dependent methyltransferase [Betaproteobacteria bacterium]|nr:class I SAM-dependent methyltransferase [Betaproteobacteria bacterium]
MGSWPSPPPYSLVGRHGVSPDTTHDERARFNFLAQLNTHLATHVLPGNAVAYEKRVKPFFEREHGRAPADRHEVRKAMLKDAHFQTWSALRRDSMEQRQQAGREIVLRQAAGLNEKAKSLNAGSPRLILDPAFVSPAYLTKVDHHCMPGGYFEEVLPDDVSAAANYDAGIFATTAGGLGRFNDGGGHALAGWLKRHHPDFNPKRILDMGCGTGHSLLPVAEAYPDAEVIAIECAAPLLRFAHARATSLGVNNITFVQANAEAVNEPDASFDLVFTTMFLHETSNKAIRKIFRETHRLARPGGLVLHLEQPQFAGLPPFEQFMRDWDAFYNNEPYWTGMHELDIEALQEETGFERAKMFTGKADAVVDEAIFGKPKPDVEDYGRKASWHLFGVAR